ncbi:hypothetical protein [Burkholderia vietnamiensis]|uniref:hypothetical protein n=2 Tax=Burkholderiaceae TaxID=119060 RepID=UPI0011865725|nr:hypothetical protein [Burkholderia vietnamiensis]
MRPESRVSRGEAEKTKGRENQSPGPSFNMVRLQDQQFLSNPLIQNEDGIDDWNMNPQTYPQSVEPMRMRSSSEKIVAQVADRRPPEQKTSGDLEIYAQFTPEALLVKGPTISKCISKTLIYLETKLEIAGKYVA